MGTVISNLKAKFGVDTSDFKKGLKDGEKAIEDFKGAASDSLDKFASMFGVNMRAVNDAINTANRSLNFVAQSFRAAQQGADIFTAGLKVLRMALISTGLGAIVVALGSIIAYFSKTGEGADKFAKILSQVKSVVNNVIERLAIFGKGLMQLMTGHFKEGWETMKGAFHGIGVEIREDWKAAGDLADREDELEDREIALISSLEERKAKIAELRLAAKEELEDHKKKLDLINQAEALIKNVYTDEIGIEKERLAIMKEKLALQTKDPTNEQRREIAEQEAKINSLLRAQAEELRNLTREKNTSLKILKEELELEKLKAQQIKATAIDLSSIKIPDVAPALNAMLVNVREAQIVVREITADISDALNNALGSLTETLGEFFGALAIGDASLKNFSQVVIGAFADLAVTVGKIVIKAALAVAGIEQALKVPGAWPIALAAGVALVAIGTALRGALAGAASGSGGSVVSAQTGGPLVYDNRTQATSKVSIEITGKLKAEGSDLVYVFNQENNRKKLMT